MSRIPPVFVVATANEAGTGSATVIRLIGYNHCNETETNRFVTEASTIGLKPGDWPDQLPTAMGNKQPFVLANRQWSKGELRWAEYRQSNGYLTIFILNS